MGYSGDGPDLGMTAKRKHMCDFTEQLRAEYRTLMKERSG